MIITELYDGQGLGNQLWAYAVTRIIAHKRNLSFSIMGRDRFHGKNFIKLDWGVEPVIKSTYKELNYKRDGCDMWPYDKNMLDVPPNTKIDGNFQSYQYIRGHEDLIREWIKLDTPYKTSDNTCVVHIRCGDYLGIPDVFLPSDYFLDAMDMVDSNFKNIEFKSVSDQPDIAEQFVPIECISDRGVDVNKAPHHFGGNVKVDFSYLVNANYLVIPNSSFAWWGAFLNTKKKMVIAPMYWAGRTRGFWRTEDIKTDGFNYI